MTIGADLEARAGRGRPVPNHAGLYPVVHAAAPINRLGALIVGSRRIDGDIADSQIRLRRLRHDFDELPERTAALRRDGSDELADAARLR
jgi:hypothetical protein